PSHLVFETGAEDQPIVQTSQHPEWFSQPSKPPTPDRDWNKSLPAAQGDAQSWISVLAKQTDARSSFNELLDTPIDFSNFIMNRLGVDTLTPGLLVGPTYELMRGSYVKMMIRKDPPLDQTGGLRDEENKGSMHQPALHLNQLPGVQAGKEPESASAPLETATRSTGRIDTLTLEVLVGPTFELMKRSSQQYPHNLLQPLSLIPDNRGRRVIPFAHFINNDLKYLWGGAFSHKYTTSVTKTKAADYGQIKWIEELVPRMMWIQEPIDYDKHAFWGVSH
nr:hypothetical protein [Tanacetum cinerariifolium]